MRARRWTTTVAAAGLTVGLLSGCTPKDGRTYPNSTDLERARQLWGDAWIATDGPSVAGPDGSPPNVERTISGRDYQTPVTTREIVTTEVRAALATGWRLLGAECDPDEQGYAGNVIAQLSRGSSMDDGARATITATTRASTTSGSPTSATPTGNPALSNFTQVMIDGYVPHHLDTTWQMPAAIDLDASCLTQRPTSTTTPPPTGPQSTPLPEPTLGRLPGDIVDPPEWGDDVLPEDLRAAVDDLGEDPGLRALGLSLTLPKENPETRERDAARATVDAATTTDGLAATVASLTSAGWTLTYAGCIGPGAPNVAELSRPAGKRAAVLRLSQVAAPSESSVEATVVVTTPGYSPEVPAGITDPCLAGSAASVTFVHSGVPHLGPARMFPLQR